MIDKYDVGILFALLDDGFEICLGVFESKQECMELYELIIREEAAATAIPFFIKLSKSTDDKAMKLWDKSRFVPAVIVLWLYVTKDHPFFGMPGLCPIENRVYEDAAEAVKAREELLADPNVVSVDMVTVPFYKNATQQMTGYHQDLILRQLRNLQSED